MIKVINPTKEICSCLCLINGLIYLMFSLCLLITFIKSHNNEYIKNNENYWIIFIISFFCIGFFAIISSIIRHENKNNYIIIYE